MGPVTDYGTVPDAAPVHGKPELADYGTVPDAAPVHDKPEVGLIMAGPDTFGTRKPGVN